MFSAGDNSPFGNLYESNKLLLDVSHISPLNSLKMESWRKHCAMNIPCKISSTNNHVREIRASVWEGREERESRMCVCVCVVIVWYDVMQGITQMHIQANHRAEGHAHAGESPSSRSPQGTATQWQSHTHRQWTLLTSMWFSVHGNNYTVSCGHITSHDVTDCSIYWHEGGTGPVLWLANNPCTTWHSTDDAHLPSHCLSPHKTKGQCHMDRDTNT